MDLLRARLLEGARHLVTQGRLDEPVQIFDLRLADVEAGLSDGDLDLRALAAERRKLQDRLAELPELPRLIDSRGRIFRPPPPAAREGELRGQAISAGVVQGPVKVLHAPDEKPLEPGDVLVARATDPGWTPLFVNAAAILLEVGGMLQHGALVAREYGKPCVAGIHQVTTSAIRPTSRQPIMLTSAIRPTSRQPIMPYARLLRGFQAGMGGRKSFEFAIP
ncbi:MAG: hypothetical protein JRI55_35055 [Deltaproteobacteria bacterium]|jgi:pyruvate,water dikinase|nr:hypothetical protein [Deltaproteobacteria bacterium]